MVLNHCTTGRLALLLVVALGAASCTRSDPSRVPAQQRPAADHPVELRDAAGNVVRFARPAERVVSLAPNLTEMICAIGARNRLIGRTRYDDYPPGVDSVPVVSDMQTPDYETILRMRPDVVLMTFAGNSQASYQKLRELGATPFCLAAADVDGVIDALDTLGRILGTAPRAENVEAALRGRLDSVRAAARSMPPVSTFVVIDHAPLVTVARGFIDDAITAAGGRNVASSDLQTYPHYSREALLRANPDVIIIPVRPGDEPMQLVKQYPEWRQLTAWRRGRVYAVPADPLTRPGPRLVDAIETLYRALHGLRPDSTGWPRRVVSAAQ